jgi:hypothetical protein
MSKRLGGYYPPLFFAYQNEPNSDRSMAMSSMGLTAATLP